MSAYYTVSPGWIVQKEGEIRPTHPSFSEQEAITAACKLCEEVGRGNVKVMNAAGKIKMSIEVYGKGE